MLTSMLAFVMPKAGFFA